MRQNILKKVSVFFVMSMFLGLSVSSQEYVEGIPDGYSMWTSNWGSESPESGYSLMRWVYEESNGWWELTQEYLEEPLIMNEDYSGPIYDMGIDLFYLEGESEPHAILAVSKGESHFPSEGTEFQHRRLNGEGNWEVVQDPIHTTPADISPLGVDVYWSDGQLRMVWLEDSDVTSVGILYDQELRVEEDGTLSVISEPTEVYSQDLDWGADYPDLGGLNGVAAVDYDQDGDRDFVLSKMFYGDVTSNVLYLLEQTSSGEYADSLQEILLRETGSGAEGMTVASVDGDENVDLLITNHAEGGWSEIYWYELGEDGLEEVGMMMDASLEGEAFAVNVDHIFGLYANEPPAIGGSRIGSWSIY